MFYNFLEIKDKIIYLAGILSKRFAYQGPPFIEIQLTNICNINCLGCYFHSARKPNRFPADWHHVKLDNQIFSQLMREAEKLNIRNIIFSGSGEPFTHPNILSFIRDVKKRRMGCRIVTNGTLIDKGMLEELSFLGLDSLILSLWDFDPKRYEALRPGHGHKLEAINETLTYYRDYSGKKKLPDIHVVFVINNKNYNKVGEMYDFAEKYRIKRISFKFFKVYDDITKDYLMTNEQIKVLCQQLKMFFVLKKRQVSSNARDFCYMLEHTQVDNYKYINALFRELPCYIGWIYMRVLLNGDVVPCCGCEKNVLGNIHQKTLSEIWRSKEYQEFRFKALTNKYTALFKHSLCDNLCSHYQNNLKFNKLFLSPLLKK